MRASLSSKAKRKSLTRVLLVVGVMPLLLPHPVLAAVKGQDLPRSAGCVVVDKSGKIVASGYCDVVCKDKTIYEPGTDDEVDHVSSDGGVCYQSAARAGAVKLSVPKSVPLAPKG